MIRNGTIAAMALAFACSDKGTESGGETAGDTEEDLPEFSVPPTLTEIEAEVFKGSCNFSSCHGGGSGKLTLGAGESHGNLVGIEACGRETGDTTCTLEGSGTILVVAGDSTSSYLLTKLTTGAEFPGVQMPKNGDPLPEIEMVAIRDWIDAGALDD